MIEDIWTTIWINGMIIFAFLSILFFMRLEAKDNTIKPARIRALVDETTKPGRIKALVNKYLTILGLALIIAGVLLWIPLILQGLVYYNPFPVTEDVTVSFAYINFIGLLQAIIGSIFLVFGVAILFNRFNRGKNDGSSY